MKPILCLDFDGVCHLYTSGWKGASVIPDPFVPGLFEFLAAVQPYFDVQIFSSRSNQKDGIEAMTAWFAAQHALWRQQGGKSVDNSPLSISFPTQKPPAYIGIDDRVLTFRGEWPDVEELRGFRTWTQDPRGPTNRFPRGKVNEYDEGELKLAIYHKDGTVFMDFGKSTSWIGLDANAARQMGRLLLTHAEQLDK